ncbi:GntR family transcriptional regulator [Streptomyces sp. S.PB5]|uniref:GntR family transcriptional regulator n=1 Tax=Streptomyces sp. S.PB5 TaxID=3020844 RepID=UPI0025AF4902|nr:GntR family transcriptional regulator [Streptomyces sp. S.PB5]MDN3026027.1 GntR family transcriptional regulator [Streptomyces sp. S.PB5]
MGHDDPPQHQLVADDLRRRLGAGEWSVGTKLPSRARMAEEYGVNPNVMQKAQERLIVEGLLEGRAGSGTYVTKPRERRRMTRSRRSDGSAPLPAGTAEFEDSGDWRARTRTRTPAPDFIARRLGIEAGDLCVRTTYELLTDGLPSQLSVSWEPLAITGRPPRVPLQRRSLRGPGGGPGVAERIRLKDIGIACAVEVPRPARATQEQADLLGIGLGDLVLVIERTYYDGDGRPVETADIVVPDVRWEVAYELGVAGPESA